MTIVLTGHVNWEYKIKFLLWKRYSNILFLFEWYFLKYSWIKFSYFPQYNFFQTNQSVFLLFRLADHVMSTVCLYQDKYFYIIYTG